MLIVGLGNYGMEYRNTYHNMGFWAADKLANMLNLDFSHSIGLAKVAMNKDKTIIIAKPQTYMNLSGLSVKALMKKFNVSLSELVVIYDDIDIPKGKIRIRDAGSAGTHNGMRSIIGEINSGDFLRIRIGIGRDNSSELKDYVLSKMNYEDKLMLESTVLKAAQAIHNYIQDRDRDRLKRENNN